MKLFIILQMSAKLVLSQSAGGFSFAPVFGPAREWYECQQQANGDILFRRVVDNLDSFGMPRPIAPSFGMPPNLIPPFGMPNPMAPPFGSPIYPRPIAPSFGNPFGNPPQ